MDPLALALTAAFTVDVVRSVQAALDLREMLVKLTEENEDLRRLAKMCIRDSIKDADVIYGDIWASMGEEDLIPKRSELLSPYRVTEETLKATGNPEVLYMHCLPSFHDFETKLAKEWHDKGVDIREAVSYTHL